MSKSLYILLALLVLAAGLGGVLYYTNKSNSISKPPGGVACTMEAKLCPDGSAVGRFGPNCEFAPCPNAPETGIIKGKVEVGPICPVERVGVPCPVPPEAYTSREVVLYAADGTTVIKRMNFAPDGTYQFAVPAGTYVLSTPKQGIGGSKDLPKTITVKSGETLVVNFSIDTGIR